MKNTSDGVDVGRPRPRARRLAVLLVPVVTLAVAATVVLARVQDPPPAPAAAPTATPSPTATVRSSPPAPRFTYTVAHAQVPRVRVRQRPRGKVIHSLSNPTANDGPLVFLVRRTRGRWLNVYLPVRPNGSIGWIHSDAVRLVGHDYLLVARRSKFVLDVYERDRRIMRIPIAVGRRDTPTPGGTFYIKELLRPPKPDFVYGTYAFGLSGFSNALDTYNGAPAVIGIHGTGDPGVIPGFASSGCIRMTNRNIERLVRFLPLGTPVRILR